MPVFKMGGEKVNNRAGILTYTDARQVQDTIVTDNFSSFFNTLRITQPGKIKDQISNIFVNGSMNRSQFFMDFRIKDYIPLAVRSGNGSNMMPVYGVKGGSPGLTRKTNYAEILMCAEDDLVGAGFNATVFGTDYLTGEETVSLPSAKLLSEIGREGSVPPATVSKRSLKAVSRVLEKLWGVQEKNPQTRFIIKMDHAEERSADLIRQVYLLIPHQLRLQLGFETNITSTDLDQINHYGGIPIYVFTADSSQNIDSGAYSFPVAVYDMAKADQYPYNNQRIALIEKLALLMNQKILFNLDYSEKKILESRQTAVSSFKYYQDIADALLSGTLFWWMRESVESIDQLEKLYTDQKELMSNPDYRAEALEAFNTRIYPNSDLAQQTVDLWLSGQSGERDRQLLFLARELNQGKNISALRSMHETLDSRYRQNEKNLRAQWEKKTGDELAGQKAAYENEIKRLEAGQAQLARDNQNLARQLEALKRDGNAAVNEGADVGKGQAAGRKAVAKLKKVSAQLQIFRIAAFAACACAILFLALFIMRNISLGNALVENAEKTAQIENLQKENDRFKEDAENLKKEIASLNEEITALKEEYEKADETEASESVQTADDTAAGQEDDNARSEETEAGNSSLNQENDEGNDEQNGEINAPPYEDEPYDDGTSEDYDGYEYHE